MSFGGILPATGTRGSGAAARAPCCVVWRTRRRV